VFWRRPDFISGATPVRSDNQSAIVWATAERIPLKRAKHIDVRVLSEGIGPGASGLRHSHIDGMITAPSPQAAATAQEALVSLVNMLASVRAPSRFAT
jgi:hypothetical protein